MNDTKPKTGGLFAGVGGIELGFEWAGFETSWFVECEEYPQRILEERFPGRQVHGDITKIDPRSLRRVDVLTGGFPCQDISNAGRRAGIEGSRSSLWKHFAEAIRVLRPRVAFIENVSALTRRGLDVVLADLAGIGYDAAWHCVPASAVGAPHLRKRIFIVAYAESERCRKEGQHSDRSEERVTFCGQDVSDTESKGLERRRIQRGFTYTNQSAGGNWQSEPCVGRVAHGVPSRVDRIKALGNAVVPGVAYAHAEAIKEVFF